MYLGPNINLVKNEASQLEEALKPNSLSFRERGNKNANKIKCLFCRNRDDRAHGRAAIIAP